MRKNLSRSGNYSGNFCTSRLPSRHNKMSGICTALPISIDVKLMSTSSNMDMKCMTHTNNGMTDMKPSLLLQIVLYCIRMPLKLDFFELDYCMLCMLSRKCKLHTMGDKARIESHLYKRRKSISIYVEC